MSLVQLRDALPDFARDTKLNLGTVLTEDGAPGLTATQIWATALACSYATKVDVLTEALTVEAAAKLAPADVEAAKAAATVMAMNNVYYRATHLAEDAELAKLPAKLRMNVIGKPGVPKADFELYCLAVSAINGCGACIASHVKELRNAGVAGEGIQSALRIAGVVNAAAQAVRIR